jgi:hypothetical protein
MSAKTATERKRTQRQKLKAQGLVPMECWVLPENKQAMKNTEMLYRENNRSKKNE